MISFFESSVRINPDAPFLNFALNDGRRLVYTYWQTRLISAAFAKRMQASGIKPGDTVTIDLPNGPEFVFSAIACAYAGYSMILLDSSLSEAEKISRSLEADRSGIKSSLLINQDFAAGLLDFVRNLPEDDSQIVRSIFGGIRRNRPVMGEEQDAVDDIVHFAERAAHLFDEFSLACIFFSGNQSKSSRSRKTKAVPLTWSNLIGSSDLVNEALGSGIGNFTQERLPFNSFSTSRSSFSLDPEISCAWQCICSLGNIEGFQTLMRSVIAKTPLFIYEESNFETVLEDAQRTNSMFISVNDKDLQELLTIEEWRADTTVDASSRLASYKCVLLIDNERNARTLKRAYDLGAPMYASHGLAQASGIIALKRVGAQYDGGVFPLEGYLVEVIDPDEDGFGKLAVRGPGVFPGYINSETAFTVDGYFITEERVAFVDGLLYWRNRSENMFVSAGQDIYPVEIAEVLRHVQGVSSVHVFGVKDSKCGMLPIAAIERSIPTLTPNDIAEKTRQWFSNFTVPVSIFVFDQLPRTPKGKLDRPAIEAVFSA